MMSKKRGFTLTGYGFLFLRKYKTLSRKYA
jgi:hypothetical protein